MGRNRKQRALTKRGYGLQIRAQYIYMAPSDSCTNGRQGGRRPLRRAAARRDGPGRCHVRRGGGLRSERADGAKRGDGEHWGGACASACEAEAPEGV